VGLVIVCLLGLGWWVAPQPYRRTTMVAAQARPRMNAEIAAQADEERKAIA
jgi:hypothetical protein